MLDVFIQVALVVALSTAMFIFTGITGIGSMVQPAVALVSVFAAHCIIHNPLGLVLLSGLIGLVVGFCITPIFMNLRGDQLLVATFCVYLAVMETSSGWTRFTGGATGVAIAQPSTIQLITYLIATFFALLIVCRIWSQGLRGSQANVFRASEQLAESLGINSASWFVRLFTLSCGFVAITLALVISYLGVASVNILSLDFILLPLGAALAGSRLGVGVTMAAAGTVASLGIALQVVFMHDAALAGPVRQIIIGLGVIAFGVLRQKAP